MGSGVLVKRTENIYTVLTAWHVINGQKPGEELDIYTSDGQLHKMESGSIAQVEGQDLATLSFTSDSTYILPEIGDFNNVNIGASVFVSGYPLPTSSVNTRIFRFLQGDVISHSKESNNAKNDLLLYSNRTLPGMSGGPVLNAKGQLVAIHASAELADYIIETSEKAIATGTNQGVPISHYIKRQRETNGFIQSNKGNVSAGKQPAMQDAATQMSPEAINPNTADTNINTIDYAYAKHLAGFHQRSGLAATRSRDYRDAVIQFNKALELDAKDADTYIYRGTARERAGDVYGAISDYTQAMTIDPEYEEPYRLRGTARLLFDRVQACKDLQYASALGSAVAKAAAKLNCR